MIKRVLLLCLLSGIALSPSASVGCDGTPTDQYGLFGVISDILMTPTYVASELFVGAETGCMQPVACPCAPQTRRPPGKPACYRVQTYYCPVQRCFVVCAPVSVPLKQVAKKTQPTPTATSLPTQQPLPPATPPVPLTKETVAKPQPLEPQPQVQPAKEPVASVPFSQPRQAEVAPVPVPAPAIPEKPHVTPAEPAPSMKVQVAPEAGGTVPLKPSNVSQSPSPPPATGQEAHTTGKAVKDEEATSSAMRDVLSAFRLLSDASFLPVMIVESPGQPPSPSPFFWQGCQTRKSVPRLICTSAAMDRRRWRFMMGPG